MTLTDGLTGRRGLILGVANDRSIAWGIAKVLSSSGARLGFTYQGERLERRVRPLAEEAGGEIITSCDVCDEQDVQRLFEEVDEKWGGLDFLVHSIAFADKSDLENEYLDILMKSIQGVPH